MIMCIFVNQQLVAGNDLLASFIALNDLYWAKNHNDEIMVSVLIRIG